MNQKHLSPSPNRGSHAAPALLAIFIMLVSGSGSPVHAQDCNCGDEVEVRGVPGGNITTITLSTANDTITGNPINVEMVPNQEIEIKIEATWNSPSTQRNTLTPNAATLGSSQAYITFHICGIEYQTHSQGGWGNWTAGDGFPLGLVGAECGSGSLDTDKFRIRITQAASNTANDPTGPGAGAGTGGGDKAGDKAGDKMGSKASGKAGGVDKSSPKMKYHAGTGGGAATQTIVPPGATATIPMGPVGTGSGGTAPFRSAGTLTVHGPITSDLAAAGGVEWNGISEVSDLVTVVQVQESGQTVEKDFVTPTKVFRLRGWNAVTQQAVSIQDATGTLVEEYLPSQYHPDDNVRFPPDESRALWRIEPVDLSSVDVGNGIRFVRTVNGITTTETVLVNNEGSTMMTEADGTQITVTVADGDTADYYMEQVERQTDGVTMASELRTYTHMPWGYEMTERVVDPDHDDHATGDELTYSYGYYIDDSQVDQVRRLRYRKEPDGNWFLYSYSGGNTQVKSPFCSDTVLTVLENDSTAVELTGGSGPGRYILASDEADSEGSFGSVRSKRELYQVGSDTPLATLSSGGSIVADVTGGAGAGGKPVRVITTTTDRTGNDALTSVHIAFAPDLGGSDAWLAGKTVLSSSPSGRATLHTWSRTGGTVTETETEGLADTTGGGDSVAVAGGWYFHVVPSASSCTVTTTGAVGMLQREVQYHTGSDFTPAYTEVSSYDAAGRLTDVSIDNHSIRHYQYPSALVTVASEAGTGTTRTQVDSRGRTVSRTTAAPNGSPIATTWTHSGLTTTMRVNGTVEETTVADTLGRIVSRTDRTGATTTTSYSNNGKEVTETGPGGINNNGATTINTTHADGRPASLTGSAVVSRFYSYSVETAGEQARLATTVNEGTSNSARWTETVVNRDGSTYQVVKPVFGGGSTVSETYAYHPCKDRLASITSTAPHTPNRLFPLDTSSPLQRFGAESVSGLNIGGDTLALNSASDRITRRSQTYAVDGSIVWSLTTEDTFPTPGSATPVTRTTWKSLKPVSCGQGLARTEVTVVPGAGTATRTLTRTTQTFAGKVVVIEDDSATSASPDSTTTYVAGRPVARVLPGATFVESWTYDALGREIRHTDSRGAATTTSYNGDGQIEVVTDAAGQPTTYTYFAATDPAAGRVASVTNPKNKAVSYGYDNLGHVTSVSGDAAYPIIYTYDSYGARATMKTQRASNQTSTTTWIHDPATGLLAKKIYKGQTEQAPAWSYTYFSDGRFETRTSRRGVVTAYDYNGLGDLESVTYSGDNDLTPDLTYSNFDRLGRPGTVTTETGTGNNMVTDTATLSYDSVTGAESITYGEGDSSLPGLAVVARDADTAGRPTGFNVTQGTSTIHHNTLTYDPVLGHLSGVSSDSGSTALSYYPGTSILRQAVTAANSNVVRRETRVMDAAGRITGVHTSAGSDESFTTLATTGYVVDELGRRTSARREDGSTWIYGYNDRSEVTSGSKHLPGTSTPLAAGQQFNLSIIHI